MLDFNISEMQIPLKCQQKQNEHITNFFRKRKKMCQKFAKMILRKAHKSNQNFVDTE